MYVTPPVTVQELHQRTRRLAGQTISDIAENVGASLPKDFKNAKGWFGQLIEQFLGANSGNLAQPDFYDLGIELKTLPINNEGFPQESTYLCTAPIPHKVQTWSESIVYKKIRRILWVPYQADRSIPIPHRHIGTPFLYELESKAEKTIRQDWLELSEMLILGQYEKLNAHHGQFLQLRPKAANSKNLIRVFNNHNKPLYIVPKGFYLRLKFTKQILLNFYNRT